MLGAIAGDIIGSVHEGAGTKTKNFPLFTPQSRFTDDTVLTVAVADALLHSRPYAQVYRDYYRQYPDRGYGRFFRRWVANPAIDPVNSYGNGSAMRVSPVAYACFSLESVLAEARRSAEVTHNHPEGIRGAQATAAAVFLARTGHSKESIRRSIQTHFGYDLNRRLEEIRPNYSFSDICQHTVPEAILAFLESTDYEDAVRNAVSLGGDADTLACIAGAIAEAYYGQVPETIAAMTLATLDDHLRRVVDEFYHRFIQR